MSGTGWTPGANTLYRNVEILAAAQAPRSYALRLGLAWGFGLPTDGRSDLTEFSFPLRPADDVPSLLRARGGLRVDSHEDPAGTELDDHLRATGEPVIAVVDSFALPYRPAYGRVHSSRTIIVEPLDRDHVLVDDYWEPTYRGPMHRRDLDIARRSEAVADLPLEPIFHGGQGQAQWFTVTVDPFPVGDPARWATEMIGTLVREMTAPADPVDAPGVSFGLAALRELVDLMAAGGDALWPAVPRRTLALVLRAELSVRRYLCVLLRNAVRLAGWPALVLDVDQYEQGLRHLQAARDVLTKSLRGDRTEYDGYVLARLRDALAMEERLLAALTGAGLPVLAGVTAA